LLREVTMPRSARACSSARGSTWAWALALPPPSRKVRVLAIAEAALVLWKLLAGMVALPCLPLDFVDGPPLGLPPFPHLAVVVAQQPIVFDPRPAWMLAQPRGPALRLGVRD